MSCSIARTLDLIGEWWTLLILRDIFFGVRRFEELLENLGVSRKVLTDRLDTLVSGGILERRSYQHRPERYEYWLTEKGLELYPVLLVLMQWGDRWMAEQGAPIEILHSTCGHLTRPVVTCIQCGEELNVHNVQTRPGPGLSVNEAAVLQSLIAQNETGKKRGS